MDFGFPARWTTFPERLEDAGISWKIYQNELSVTSGLNEEQDAWLANFSDNPIEWFPQFAVQFAKTHREYIQQVSPSLPHEIETLEDQISAIAPGDAKIKAEQDLDKKRKLLKSILEEQQETNGKSLDQLPERIRSLHAKAFTTNAGDLDYRKLTALQYADGAVTRELQIPKGDILHQFRDDAMNGKLPAVSWIVPPEKFSDHPTAAWYGAWYVAEVMNILTQNPELWRKTVFILTYDENDGFFDHIPPFGSPCPGRSETGAVSAGIDTGVEYVTLEQDLSREPAAKARGGSIGLGFRVPLIVASPWSRGGAVCSQVFDHTSVLQFLENFASHKSGKKVEETNISEWRRAVCGDLTSVFESRADKVPPLPFPDKDAFIERIYNAKFKSVPPYRSRSSAEIERYVQDPRAVSWMPRQEPGMRPARSLPYELNAEGRLSEDRRLLQLTLSARNERFGRLAAGAPFHIYTPFGYLHKNKSNRTRSYAVKPGQSLFDTWELAGFTSGRYHLRVCGPNGFYLELMGDQDDPLLESSASCSRGARSQLTLSLKNKDRERSYTAVITHNAYGAATSQKVIRPGEVSTVILDLTSSHGWYDFRLQVEAFKSFERLYAGHVEDGKPSFSDPQMS